MLLAFQLTVYIILLTSVKCCLIFPCQRRLVFFSTWQALSGQHTLFDETLFTHTILSNSLQKTTVQNFSNHTRGHPFLAFPTKISVQFPTPFPLTPPTLIPYHSIFMVQPHDGGPIQKTSGSCVKQPIKEKRSFPATN